MKKGGGSRKGGKFERDICKRLSLWWTNNYRDDVFWRSQASGGRATNRHRKGKTTKGQQCDIQAADPIGEPLLRWAVIECKDGYPGKSICDLFDKPNLQQHPLYEQWISKAAGERKQAGSKHFLLIARRKNKKTMVYMPYKAAEQLPGFYQGCFDPELQLVFKRHKTGRSASIVGTSLECFLNEVTPHCIKVAVGTIKRGPIKRKGA